MGRLVYTALLWLLLPLVPLRLLWRGRRQPEYLEHIGERFGRCYPALPSKPVVWLHAVSVGETHAAAPLVKLLKERYPQHVVVLTHGTPTGRAAGQQLFGDTVIQAYLPYDLPFAVRKFLNHFKPQLGLIMETELWFNLIAACHARSIPLLLVNARLSAKSAKGYAKLGWLVEEGLCQFAVIAAQTESDARRLCDLGAPEVAITGNLKFDVAAPVIEPERIGKLCGKRMVLLAASTREGEETLILEAFNRAAVPGLLLVMVPRHPQRFDEVAGLLKTQGVRYRRRSEDSPVEEDVQVLLGDSMGEMAAYYAACDFAFVGGSLLPLGGQNLIEACAQGKPVIVGPYTFNFEEAASQAVMQGAVTRVWDVAGLADEIRRLAGDARSRREMGEAGLRFAAANRGATQRTLALIERFIESAG